MGHSCHVSLSALPKIFSDSGMVCVANIAVELMKMRCSVSLADKVTRSKLWYDLLEGRTLSQRAILDAECFFFLGTRRYFVPLGRLWPNAECELFTLIPTIGFCIIRLFWMAYAVQERPIAQVLAYRTEIFVGTREVNVLTTGR